MTLSKSQTDAEILEGASAANNEISEVRTRHTDSVHPLDCGCELCTLMRNRNAPEKMENVVKESLNWYDETNP